VAVDPAAPSVRGSDLGPGAGARLHHELKVAGQLTDWRPRPIGNIPGSQSAGRNAVRRLAEDEAGAEGAGGGESVTEKERWLTRRGGKGRCDTGRQAREVRAEAGGVRR
jgi:hypothetical protein